MVWRVTGDGASFSKTLNTLRFGGEEDDVYEWMSRIDQYFALRDVPEEQRLSMVFYHLEGDALTWFQWLETNCLLTTWSNFLINVKYRFGSSKFEESEGRILKLDQSGSAADYQFEMEEEYEKSQVKVQEDEQEVNEVVVQEETKEASETSFFVNLTQQPPCIEIQEVVQNGDAPIDFELKAKAVEHTCREIDVFTYGVQEDKQVYKNVVLPQSLQHVLDEEIRWVDEGAGLVRWWSAYIIYEVVVRRRAILKFYAREEVYMESLNLHLEDKVVVEEGGSVTTLGLDRDEPKKLTKRGPIHKCFPNPSEDI